MHTTFNVYTVDEEIAIVWCTIESGGSSAFKTIAVDIEYSNIEFLEDFAEVIHFERVLQAIENDNFEVTP